MRALLVIAALLAGCSLFIDLADDRPSAGAADAEASDVGATEDGGPADRGPADATQRPDARADAAPGCEAARAERCDGLDQDCDGRIDEDTDERCYDGPAATAGVGPCRAGARACAAELGSGAPAFGPCEGAVLPAAERCNAIDDDCDGRVDADADGPVQQACYPFDQGEPGVGLCEAGRSTCSAGAFGPCNGAQGPRAELPNTIDDDCDGQVDEGS